MHTPLPVFAIEVGVVGTARPAGVGEDQDALGAIHEGLSLGNIGRPAAAFEPLLSVPPQDQSSRPARHFGDAAGSKVFDNRIKRRCDRRQGAELFDQRIARGDGAWTHDRITIVVAHRFGTQIAVFVGEDLHQTSGEALWRDSR